MVKKIKDCWSWKPLPVTELVRQAQSELGEAWDRAEQLVSVLGIALE